MTQQITGENAQQSASPPSSRFSARRLFIATFAALGAGFTASLMAVVLMGILRLTAGVPTPVELFGDFVLKHISVDTFIRLLLSFGPNAKTAPLDLTLLGMIGTGR